MNNVKTSDITLVVQKFSPYINGLCRKLFIVGGTSEDLYEEGIIGLLEACNSYNGESLFEARFEAFAKMCIKRQIIDAIRVANAQKNRALNESVSLLFSDNDGDEQSLLDIFASVGQGIIPYGAQLLSAATLTGLTPYAIMPYLFYPIFMAISAICFIAFKKGEK